MSDNEIEQLTDRYETNLRKGTLVYAVLHVLRHGPVYSSDILKGLRQADLIVVEGTVYPLLSRLHQEGVLAYEWRESESGPPRKYYELTDAGRRVLVGMMPRVHAVMQALQKLEDGKGATT